MLPSFSQNGNNADHGATLVIVNSFHDGIWDAATRCMQQLYVCDMSAVLGRITALATSPILSDVTRWVFDNEKYKNWVDEATGSQLLWISGQSGAGKTMLSFHISQVLQARHQTSGAKKVVYHFCSMADQEHKRPISVVRAIMWNVLDKWPHLRGELDTEYRKQGGNLFQHSSQDSLSSLWRIWLQIIAKLHGRTIWIILDGFDSLDEEGRNLFCLVRMIVSFFVEGQEQRETSPQNFEGSPSRSSVPDPTRSRPAIVNFSRPLRVHHGLVHASLPFPGYQDQQRPCQIKLVVLSRRNSPDWLQEEFAGFPCLQLDRLTNSAYNQSFQIYLDQRLSMLNQTHPLTSGDRSTVTQAFLGRNDSSFVAINHFLDRIKVTPPTEASRVVQEAPTENFGVYLQALNEIPESFRRPCAAIIRWTSVIQKPMTIDQLAMGLQFSIGRGCEWQYLVKRIQASLSHCKSLLTVNEGPISFIHQSALEFALSTEWHGDQTAHLQSFWFDHADAHAQIVRACLRCLMWEDMLREPINLKRFEIEGNRYLQEWPFLAYAIRYWPEHARLARLDATEYNLPFFCHQSTLRDAWWISYHMARSARVSWKWLAPKKFSLLHLACTFDLVGLAEHVERNGWLPKLLNSHDSHRCLPIELAQTSNSMSMMVFMLQRNAWLEDRRYTDYSVLHNAAANGNVDMAQVILANRRVHIDLPGTRWIRNKAYSWFLLMRTVAGAVDSILNSSVDNLVDLKPFGTNVRPLHLAAKFGQEHMSRFLLGKNASVNAPTSTGLSPLHIAALYGRAHMVEMLLFDYDSTSSINSVTNESWTPLHCAAWSGNWQCIELLIQKKARIDVLTSEGESALHIAVIHRHLAVAVVLMNHQARLDIFDHKDRTPLMWASALSWEEGVQHLVDHGANVSATDKSGKTALSRALHSGKREIARLLQDGPQPFPYFPYFEDQETDTDCNRSEKKDTRKSTQQQTKSQHRTTTPPPTTPPPPYVEDVEDEGQE